MVHLLLAVLSGLGTGNDPRASSIDSIFARYDHTDTPGCALGVFRADRIIYSRGYGMADLNQGVPIRPNTVFYVASMSKQFTAMSIALLAEEGRLALSDPVRKWIPELSSNAAGVTLDHLIHHTSGIRDFLGLWALSGRAVADEIPLDAALDLIARQQALGFEPGSRFSYSNSGYLLLAEVVHRASGQSIRDFAAARMFGPLGMTSTVYHDNSTDIVPRRAEGYQAREGGGFEIVRTSFALVGDGGLLTTVDDLLQWDRNFYHNRLGRGTQSLIQQVTTPGAGALADGQPQPYAFGLFPDTYRGLEIIEHSGAFIGFRTQLLRFPTEHFSVAVLCNDYAADVEELAQRVADRYLADRFPPPAPVAAPASGPGSPSVAPERLDRWVGRYEISPGSVGRVSREGTRLSLAVFGAQIRLVSTSDSTFVGEAGPLQISFSATAAGPTLFAKGFGMTKPAPGLAPAPSLTPTLRQAYAGRYVSEELDTWAVIEAEGESMRMRIRWARWRGLEPVAPDFFLVDRTKIGFERDRNGRVVAFTLGNVAGQFRFARSR